MAYTVVEARAGVRAALGVQASETVWSDALLDEALREALRSIDAHGPVYEATVAASAGADQDLSAVAAPAALVEVTGLAWPWREEVNFEEAALRFRARGGAGLVRLRAGPGGVLPAAGDALRVRYRKVHALEGLDGAAATTLPAALEQTLALGGACHAVRLRRRLAIENPALPAESVIHLEAWGRELERAFFVDLLERTRGGANPVWAGVGL